MKQFSSFEYPLAEYICVFGNYNADYLGAGLRANGYFDSWNLSTAEVATRIKLVEAQRESLLNKSSFPTGFKTYQLIFRPMTGIFNCLKPLAANHEVKLSFERAPSEAALVSAKSGTDNPLKGKTLDIKNAYVKSKYLTSMYLRNTISEHDDQIYEYDEISVYQKSIPTGEKSIRLPNIIGGQTPNYIFAGILPASALNPDKEICMTEFKLLGVEEFAFTLNGQNLSGFPLMAKNGSPIEIYENYIRTTNRKYNNSNSSIMGPHDFKMMHCIYAFKFDNQNLESGWIGVNMKLSDSFDQNHVLGKFFSNQYYLNNYFSALDFPRCRC